MLLYLSPILAIFVFLVAIFPLKVNRWWKLLIFGILLCVSQKYFILYLFGGPVFFAPRLPRGVMLFSAWIYAVLIAWFAMLLFSVIVRGIVRGIVHIRKKTMPENWKKWIFGSNFALLGIAIFCTTLGIYWGTALPEVRERTIYLNDLPAEADGMKIALLADLHIDYITRPEFIREIVSKVQTMRKEAGFNVMDHINITIKGSEKAVSIALAGKEGIVGDTLADSLENTEPKGFVKQWDINGEDLTIGVEKI